MDERRSRRLRAATVRAEAALEKTLNSLKSILVQMDTSSRSLARLQLACDLAFAHDASVTALYPRGPEPAVPKAVFYEGQTMPDRRLQLTDRVHEVRGLFERGIQGKAGRVALETVHGEPVHAFSRQALCADLVVLGQRQPDNDDDSDLPADFAESVLLTTGRPAILVPHIGVLNPLDGVALVAWKESPESARALSAALPLLRRAERVHIATWDDPGRPAKVEPKVDVEAYLARHGVQATSMSYGPATRELGEQLLSMVVDLGAGLLVMGCYGQSRAREWALGGATRSVMHSMTVPVLMAH
jgi:nucleotide-binding universal stress UspA family protein